MHWPTTIHISEAFDKVWHDGLLFKSKTYGAEGDPLLLLKNYPKNRKQRVVLNGQTSERRKINCGVPQGSVLGPLLFVTYINDLPDGIISIWKAFADDTSIFSKVQDINKSAINLIVTWKKLAFAHINGKCNLTPILNKQANKVIFSRKSNSNSVPYPSVKFKRMILLNTLIRNI